MLSVIVPTYNERENIPDLVDRTLKVFDHLGEPGELLFVDDNSPDGTAELIRTLAAERGEAERVRVMMRTADRGLAKAVVAGLDAVRGDVAAVMDADLSHPPEVLAALLGAIRAGADVAVASRYVPGGGTEGWPLRRRFISRVACWLARGITRVKDATSGYFALRREALAGVGIKPRGYKIGLEVLAQLRGARVAEVPFVFRDRRYGSSKLSGAVMGAYLVQLATLYRARFPLVLGYVQFGLVGVLGMVIDAIVFGLGFYYLTLAGLGTRDGGFLAQTLSFTVAAGFNFVLNGLWTFRERSQGAKFRVFLAVSAAGFALRSLVFELVLLLPIGTSATGPWLGRQWLALVGGIGIASFWNYYGSLRWAFRGTPRPVGELPAPEPLRGTSRAVAVFVVAAALVLFFAAKTPLAYDEAYYWQWSRHLAWSYYDHPPMIAFLIDAGTKLLGVNELGVRLVPLLLALTIPWIARELARRYWELRHAAAWTLAVAVCIPLLSVGMTVATPDTPLVFCWGASLLAVVRALERERWTDWLLAGALVGLGVLSKYPMVLIYPALLAALLASARGRRALGRPGPYIAVLGSLAVAAPALLWQLSHGGAGLLFQLRHGLGEAAGGASAAPGMAGLAAFIGAQLVVMSPILFVLFLVALGRVSARLVWPAPAGRPADPQGGLGPLNRRELLPFLVYPTVIPLLVFGGASLFAASGANWMAPAYVTATVLIGGELARQAEARNRRWRRWLATGGIGIAALLSVYVHVETVVPIVPYGKGSVLTQTWGHRAVAAWVRELERRYAAGERVRVLASDYKLASILAFYLPDHPETCSPFERGSGSAYYAWQRPAGAHETGLYLTRVPQQPVAELFRGFRSLGEHTTWRKGQVIHRTWAYLGTLRPHVCALGFETAEAGRGPRAAR